MSRISSFKRGWQQDDPTDDVVDADWPPSPEPPKKKSKPLPTQPDDSDLTPKERRMRAIQAALRGSDASSSADTSSSSATPSSTAASSSTAPSSHEVASSMSSALSRQLPWNASHDKLKAAKNANKPPSSAGGKASSSKDRIGGVFLSQEQQYVLKQAKDGKSVFFTGSAGTGKSVLLREIITQLKLKHSKKNDAVAITASTGIAACNVGGVTLHSFTGAGICIEPPNELVAKIRKNKKANARWLRTEVLIIDEVSMVDGDLFDKLEKVAKIMKHNSKPFGGIQLIVTGDFFQLPPVMKNQQPVFAFEAASWEECIGFTFNLTQVFRQKDQEFVDMLNRMRIGELIDKDTARFKSLRREPYYDDGIAPTELFPRREDVDRANKSRMQVLKGQSMTYKAIDGGTIADPQQRQKVLANFMAPEQLVLCVDSQVMLIKNTDDAALVNGSIGKVIGFCDPSAYGGVVEDSDEIIRTDIILDPTTKEGKKLWERKQRLIAEGKIEEAPVVRFQPSNSSKPRCECISREIFKVELPSGEVQVSRSQFPLILSWAMSIHKSQGQTLDRVKVDLGRVFEKGQAYVALSRATSLQGLQVLNFDPAKVQAHPKVVQWYKTLPTMAKIRNKPSSKD